MKLFQVIGDPNKAVDEIARLNGEIGQLREINDDLNKNITRLREERDARVSVELLNLERETYNRIRADKDRLREQNAELLAAFKQVDGWYIINGGRGMTYTQEFPINQLRAAIAKAKEKP